MTEPVIFSSYINKKWKNILCFNFTSDSSLC